jgi:AcrR family transcriptional regulator
MSIARSLEPKMTTKRARTRARLIQATLELLGRDGLHRLSLDSIASHVGVTKGAIYDSFASKDALIVAAITSRPDLGAGVFVWPTGRHGTVKGRLRRLGRAVLRGFDNCKPLAVRQAEFLLYALTHEEVRIRIEDPIAYAPVGTEKQVLGLFTPEELPMPALAFAFMLNSLIPGLMYARILTPRQTSDDLILTIFEGLAGCGLERRQ